MEVPRFWRLKGPYLRLEGEQCPSCEGKIFPPRDICPHCGGSTITQDDTQYETIKVEGIVTENIHVESTFIPQKDNIPARVETTTIAIVKEEDGSEVPVMLKGPQRIPAGSLLRPHPNRTF